MESPTARAAAGPKVTQLHAGGRHAAGTPSPAVPLLRESLDGLAPKVALVLGSRLADLAEEVEGAASFPYDRLEGWPRQTVGGQRGRAVLGRLGGMPVVVLQGRSHYHERGDARAMRRPLSDLAELGIETVVVAGSCRSLREDMPPGAILLVEDHVNWAGVDPLVGEEGEARFLDMRDAYDPGLLSGLAEAAAERSIDARTGVYAWFSGPSGPTPAEARAARGLGADAAGTSTVPEVILARRFGLRVAALSLVAPAGPRAAEEASGEAAALQTRPALVLLRDAVRIAS